MINDEQEIVMLTFDVGGKLYRISKDVLCRFPGTLLYKLASEVDHHNNHNNRNNDHDPIYIDGNGRRFPYVLAYMRDPNNELELPPTICRQAFFHDMEYYGFRCRDDILFPKEVKYIDDIQYHYVTWDVTRASGGLLLNDTNRTVTWEPAVASDGLSWRSAMATDKFKKGIHYWSLEIKSEESAANVMIGISNRLVVTQSTYPGKQTPGLTSSHSSLVKYKSSYDPFDYSKDDAGVCYNGFTGNLHRHGGDIAFGPTYGNGDIIGVLCNMNHRTVTFYKNGIRIGIAADANILLRDEEHYYPCVSLSSQSQEIRSVAHKEIFSC